MTSLHQENLDALRHKFQERLKSCKTAKDLEIIRNEFIGRKSGLLTDILKSLKDLPPEERQIIGPVANLLRQEAEVALDEKIKELSEKEKHSFDVTRPGQKIETGHLHILTQVREEIEDIFTRLNFSIIEGPEVETEHYNFDALNIPEGHPAREMWDTFWLSDNQKVTMINDHDNDKKRRRDPKIDDRKFLLRTHTSPMQIRYMEKNQPPFRIIVPGRVFRYEATDASHEINFNQIEGLMVGPDITLANFKYFIETFLNLFFEYKVDVRMRPSYFPFVEPGLEIDIRHKEGNQKWLEVMGAGMVHPKVFEAVHYTKDVQGFAFGLGLERMAMIKYKIPDIRLFYSGDLRFIKQF